MPYDDLRMCVHCGEVYVVEDSVFIECREACTWCSYCRIHDRWTSESACPEPEVIFDEISNVPVSEAA